MNLETLNKLSTEALHKLKEAIEKVLDSRLDRTPRIGRIGTFKSKDGLVRTASITKINRTTFSCQESGTSVSPGTLWKVSIGAFEVTPVERRENQPVRFAVPHTPKTNTADNAW